MTMAALEMSCGLPPSPQFADLAVLAEELGYRRVWIFDSAPFWEDPFVHLALAAQRTTRVGLSTAVLVPAQRSPMAAASAIATIARVSKGRFRACFGTGFTARRAIGQRPWTLRALKEYVDTVRALLAGATPSLDGAAIRMLHSPGRAEPRPIEVPIWLSVFGPRGAEMAADTADGIIGFPHPTLPTATMFSGTVLEADEDPACVRAKEAIAPWRVVGWHDAYATGGSAAVDELPGGRAWRLALEALSEPEHRHLYAFEGHVTDLRERDRILLDHIDTTMMVGNESKTAARLRKLADAGFCEAIYTPTGPDVARELRTMMSAHRTAVSVVN
jgi:5,10-methylenetetrahydromethanopterin reductase